MLEKITFLFTLSEMAITLWMAFYLLARGFPNRITIRAVIVLFALSVFFFSATINLFHQEVGTASLRAVMLMIGLGAWYSLTFNLVAMRNRKQLFWPGIFIYALGLAATLLLVFTPSAFVGEQGNLIFVASMGVGIPYILYGAFQIVACIGILYNLLKDQKIGLSSQGRYFLLASIFPTIGVAYGVLSLISINPMPRLYQDLLVFSGVFILGLSVLRHQSLVERRTTLREFPFTSATIFLLASLYGYLSSQLGINPVITVYVVAFAIFTHAIYDLVREYLERVRHRKESVLRKQLRQFESDNTAGNILKIHLQEALELLCQNLKSSGGLIAIRQGDDFIVIATKFSLALESRIATDIISCDHVCQADGIANLQWIAPSYEGQNQVAIVGINKPKARLEYSTGDLDLLAEVADQLGAVVSIHSLQPGQKEKIIQLVAESEATLNEMVQIVDTIKSKIEIKLDQDFIKRVEDALRNLSDYIILGESSLAETLGITAESHIERGKLLYLLITESIDAMKPGKTRPAEPLPQLWYNHIVLFDAYVMGVPNREIMARLYISEGTFNRTRRNALRGLARLLIEKRKA